MGITNKMYGTTNKIYGHYKSKCMVNTNGMYGDYKSNVVTTNLTIYNFLPWVGHMTAYISHQNFLF